MAVEIISIGNEDIGMLADSLEALDVYAEKSCGQWVSVTIKDASRRDSASRAGLAFDILKNLTKADSGLKKRKTAIQTNYPISSDRERALNALDRIAVTLQKIRGVANQILKASQ